MGIFKAPKAPKPPDPKVVAGAQTGSNISTAAANAILNNVNQIGPEGSVTYDQSGSMTIPDPATGQSYTVPRWTQTTSLTPEGQQIYDINQASLIPWLRSSSRHSARSSPRGIRISFLLPRSSPTG